jgi:hypothetical protein
MPVRLSAYVPEFTTVARDDAMERLHAMTMHHIDLSLLDLTETEDCYFAARGELWMHPRTWARQQAVVLDGPRT